MSTNTAFVTDPDLSGVMERVGSRLESRVLAALQKLLALCLQAPEVDRIDTGPDPGTGSTVLQVHVRNAASRFHLGPFETIDGIPVRVIVTEADLLEGDAR